MCVGWSLLLVHFYFDPVVLTPAPPPNDLSIGVGSESQCSEGHRVGSDRTGGRLPATLTPSLPLLMAQFPGVVCGGPGVVYDLLDVTPQAPAPL